MTFVFPPDSEEDIRPRTPPCSKKVGTYRDSNAFETPDTAVSSKVSSLGTLSVGSKRGTDELSAGHGVAKRSNLSVSSLKATRLKLDDTSVSPSAQRPLKLQDLLSSSEDDSEDADENPGVVPIHKIKWDDLHQQKAIYKANYEVDDDGVPSDYEELVESNIKKMKATDLRQAIPILKPESKVPATAKLMREKLLKMVSKALERKNSIQQDNPKR